MKIFLSIIILLASFFSFLNAEINKYPSWCGFGSDFYVISSNIKVSRDVLCTGEYGYKASIVKDRFKYVSVMDIRTKEQYDRYLNKFYNQYLKDKNAKPKKYDYRDYLELIFGLLAISFIVYVGMTGMFMGYNDFKRRF
jgi:hypothetical protein